MNFAFASSPPAFFKTALFAFALLVTNAHAQDGGQIYTTYCSACHGLEGKGQPVAGIPPLAGSRWVVGEPERSIQIVLHGVMGPMEVNGKVYNSMMPAQGLVLSDDQIAAALSYVRSNWGNRETEAVTPDQVAAERERTAERTAPWEAIELLKQFPLPVEEVLFTKIEAAFLESADAAPVKIAADKLPQNLISMKAAGQPLKKGSMLQFTGEITIPKDDVYTVFYGSKMVASFEVDGKRVFNFPKGTSPTGPKEVSMELAEGVYPFKLALTKDRDEKILFSWKSGESPVMKSLIYGDLAKAWETIELVPRDELYFYRGSIDQGGSARAISVGSPLGLHFTFDPITAAPTLLWSGRFIDAGRHWTNRGSGLESPMGRAISNLVSSQGWLDEMPEEWPLYDVDEPEVDIRNRFIDYLGYALDPDRLGVTFRYLVGGNGISDHYRAESGTLLVRKLGNLSDEPVFLNVLSQGEATTAEGLMSYAIDKSTTLDIVSASRKKLRWVPFGEGKVGVIEIPAGGELILNYTRN